MSAWLVRSALLCLAAGVTLGAVLLAGKAGGWPLPSGRLLLVHRELVVVGWMVQLALGVGLWILPPVRGVAIRERRGRAVALLLNGGILLFAAGSWLAGGGAEGDYLMATGRVLEGLAVVGFGVPLLRKPFR